AVPAAAVGRSRRHVETGGIVPRSDHLILLLSLPRYMFVAMRPLHEYEEVDRWIRFGMSTRGIERLTGIDRCTVRDWRRKGNPHTRVRRKPGPKPGSSGWARADCPQCASGTLPSETYAYLLGIYLGDGHITEIPRG